MKTIIIFLVCVATLSATSYSQSLTVHEWGTFTTLHGSDGGTLSGLSIEEEQLPSFVYHHPGFSPDPSIATKGYYPTKNVTVKMETPILYFYSDSARDVKVHVDFPTGTISQWYPNRSGGEAAPSGDTLDLALPKTGLIDWDVTVLEKNSNVPLSQPNVSSHKWTDPRLPKSNRIKNSAGEIEKYLFYRGLANFPLPVEVKFADADHLIVKNTGSLDIPFIYIYDHAAYSFEETVGIWGLGPMKAGETKTFERPKTYYNEWDDVKEDTLFRNALQSQGLTYDEADAMLRTWEDGYFQTYGFKVFWIVPRELTDEILPLQITPQPDSIIRVLVGKTQVITLAAESILYAKYKEGNISQWANDPNYLAYVQRMRQIEAAEKAAEEAKKLTVHEWGTFTTLRGSDGGTLSGLFIEEEQLPPFVYHHPGFSPDPSIAMNGYHPVKAATVKMETPVLYFYTQEQKNVNVHVDFPHGTITQWYPERTSGEVAPASDTVDLTKEQTGFIEWDATVLKAGDATPYTETNINSQWAAQRNTNGNTVKNSKNEAENFLFYRGLANFSLPVDVKFSNDGSLLITNSLEEDIPFFYIYDHTTSNEVRIWSTGSLKKGESRSYFRPDTFYTYDQGTPEYNLFRDALVNAGLRNAEANAMLQTWTSGYFQTEGFKVFWVVPRQLTDKILPLEITPQPDTLERVLVAKTEILTPAFEKQLFADYKSGNMDKYKNDKYYHAFTQRIAQLPQASAKHSSVGSELAISPNPASSIIHLTGISDAAAISIKNLLGETIMSDVNTSGRLDVSKLSAGLYVISVQDGSRHHIQKFIKQ